MADLGVSVALNIFIVMMAAFSRLQLNPYATFVVGLIFSVLPDQFVKDLTQPQKAKRGKVHPKNQDDTRFSIRVVKDKDMVALVRSTTLKYFWSVALAATLLMVIATVAQVFKFELSPMVLGIAFLVSVVLMLRIAMMAGSAFTNMRRASLIFFAIGSVGAYFMPGIDSISVIPFISFEIPSIRLVYAAVFGVFAMCLTSAVTRTVKAYALFHSCPMQLLSFVSYRQTIAQLLKKSRKYVVGAFRYAPLPVALFVVLRYLYLPDKVAEILFYGFHLVFAGIRLYTLKDQLQLILFDGSRVLLEFSNKKTLESGKETSKALNCTTQSVCTNCISLLLSPFLEVLCASVYIYSLVSSNQYSIFFRVVPTLILSVHDIVFVAAQVIALYIVNVY